MTEIVVAIISACGSVLVGIFAFYGVKITNQKANDNFENKLVTAQAVTTEKLDNLTNKVEKHNKVVERMYKIEENQAIINEQIKVANHRISDLEERK